MPRAQDVLTILRSTPSLAVPHLWSGGYRALNSNAELLQEWIRVSGAWSESINGGAEIVDEKKSSLLGGALRAAAAAGVPQLNVGLVWSPWYNRQPENPGFSHPSGVWDQADIERPFNDAKWQGWENHWRPQLQAWGKSVKAAADEKHKFRLTVLFTPECFLSTGGNDEKLTAIYRKAQGLAREHLKLDALGVEYHEDWYHHQAMRWTKKGWERLRTIPPRLLLSEWASPAGYDGEKIRRTIERIEETLKITDLPVSPAWTPAGGPSFGVEGFRSENLLTRVEKPAKPGEAALWHTAHSVGLGAYFAELAQRGKLACVVTWCGPGFPHCDPVTFARRFSDMSRGVHAGMAE